jgi:F1F0 ATPase subunit 2
MTLALHLLLALLAGVLLGGAYFGGLWWTVRRLPRSPRPLALAIGSFWLRIAVVLSGLYLVAWGRWEAVLAAVAGVVIARELLRRRLAPSGEGAS